MNIAKAMLIAIQVFNIAVFSRLENLILLYKQSIVFKTISNTTVLAPNEVALEHIIN